MNKLNVTTSNPNKGPTSPPPPRPGVNISYKNLTPAEKAKMQAHMRQAMAQMNYNLNQAAQAVGHIGGVLGSAPGTAQARQTKQPQDKVLRLVTYRGKDKSIITQCVFMFGFVMFLSVSLGAVLRDNPWAALLVLFPIAYWFWMLVSTLKEFFKSAEAKADLLNWPEK